MYTNIQHYHEGRSYATSEPVVSGSGVSPRRARSADSWLLCDLATELLRRRSGHRHADTMPTQKARIDRTFTQTQGRPRSDQVPKHSRLTVFAKTGPLEGKGTHNQAREPWTQDRHGPGTKHAHTYTTCVLLFWFCFSECSMKAYRMASRSEVAASTRAAPYQGSLHTTTKNDSHLLLATGRPVMTIRLAEQLPQSLHLSNLQSMWKLTDKVGIS